ncbi:Major facilitator superfamily [Trinorchestia longiramus]|nr:Major facilitator superfamily [Trinorchestia longiramus]
MKEGPEKNSLHENGNLYPELKELLPPEEGRALKTSVQLTSVSGPGDDRKDGPVIESPSWRGPFLQIIAASFASLSAVSIGFTTGYSSLVLPQLLNDSSIDYDADTHAEWIASLPSITSIGGSLVGGVIMDKIGPRTTLLVTALPCLLSWGFVAFASSVSVMLVGRGLTGVFLGIYSPVPQVRRTQTHLLQVYSTSGAHKLPVADVQYIRCSQVTCYRCTQRR